MTVLGAVVFGGILILGVLWLLVTAPAGDADHTWSDGYFTSAVDAAPGGAMLTRTP